MILWIISGQLVGYAQIDRVQTYYDRLSEKNPQPTISFIQPESNLVDDYFELEQIILIRHGEPDLKKSGWFNRKEAIEFIRNYDEAGVKPLSFIPVELKAGELNTVYTSTLNRSKHSARLIFGDSVDYDERFLFREFERHIIRFPNIKLPLKFWTTTARLSSILGSRHVQIESFRSAKARAKKAVQALEAYAAKDKKVVLVAHGFLNRYLIKYLKRQGWTLARDGGSDYLAASHLVRVER